MKLNIGFFLGSKFGKGKTFSNLTKKVARWISKNNHNIIFDENSKFFQNSKSN